MIISLVALQRAIQFGWNEDTAKGEWNSVVPSLNQCAVTALVVQDYLGGDLIRCETLSGDSHYWNRVGNIDIDLTRDQFWHLNDRPKRETAIIRDREYVLSFPDTEERYELLSKRVALVLEDDEWYSAIL